MALDQLQSGDLVFFGPSEKATHVGLYLGEGRYIHSSGKNGGRNGIGIDVLAENSDEPVSRHYYQQFRGAGRVCKSYLPQDSDS
ncbi:C40 family peptidase [Oscillatoria acuminata]|uniref:C40 family peptidase n=1 Tax=Oscillatoria acuminata TaxID=118323 RepID=UPI0002D7AE75